MRHLIEARPNPPMNVRELRAEPAIQRFETRDILAGVGVANVAYTTMGVQKQAVAGRGLALGNSRIGPGVPPMVQQPTLQRMGYGTLVGQYVSTPLSLQR